MNESNFIECNSLEAIDKTILSEQTKFWLSEIIAIENYFYQEINQGKSCNKKLNKYVTDFDDIDKILIVLSASSRGVSIISFTSIVIVNIFGLIEEILKLKPNVTGKLSSISIKTYQHKNIEKD